MNENKTQNALQGFCEAYGIDAERLKAKTSSHGLSGSLSDKRLQEKAKAGAKAAGDMINLSESSHGGCHGINER